LLTEPARPIIRTDIPYIAECRAAFSYHHSFLARLLRRHKQEPDLAERIGNGIQFGLLLARVWRTANWFAELVVCVPSSAERLAKRGYNPAELIALEFARFAALPYHPAALIRVKESVHQRQLRRDERLTAVVNAYKASASAVKARRLILVDDVVTTGATLSACGQALHSAGALSVYALCAASVGKRRGKKM
jgi:ComF family protein